jgi:two-component system sensor kinase FixL
MRFRNPQRTSRLIVAAIVVAIIAFIDWRVEANITFGFLYLLPVVLVGTVATRWQILFTAVLCTFLAGWLGPPSPLRVSLPQDILTLSAMVGSGLFSYEVARSRRIERENLERLEREVAARREAEEQLEFLIESSPAAIFTMSSDFLVLRANSAAHRLLGVPAGELAGRNICRYIPALGRVPLMGESFQTFRTEMQCHGDREQGEVFLANVFFSTYRTGAGYRMAALVVDASEELRQREELSLEQLMAGSRILVGAVSHEIRNVCGAIAVIYENLVRSRRLAGNKDFEALGSLVETLNKISSLELKQSTGDSDILCMDLVGTLDDLRIVLEPYCREADISLRWNIPRQLPPVWADRHRLLQVLLNLTKNSERALMSADVRRLDISASVGEGSVSIRVTDSGPGVGSAEKLFQPFQRGADSTGLGLYISRAFMRSFHGDLRYDPATPGCSFVIDLVIAEPFEKEVGGVNNEADAAAVSR